VACFACGQKVEEVLVARVVGPANAIGVSYCTNCGRPINLPTTACPACGRLVFDPLAKSKAVAGVLGLLLGPLGVHRFYLGNIGIGLVQLVVTTVTCGAGGLWGVVEGILILVGSVITTDAKGRKLRD
jgi:TM2 domain-containing membrane protein YozV